MIANLSALKMAAAMVEVQLNDQVIIDSDDKGWHIRAIDPSHVAFSKVDIPAESFTDYEVWGIFCIDIAKMTKALKDKGDAPEISLNNGSFVVKGEGMTTKVRLQTPPEDTVRAPDPEAPANSVLNTSQLKRIIKALDEQNSLKITISADGLHIESFDEFGAGSRLDIPAEECVAVDGEGRSRYPVRMFQAFAGILPNDVEMDLGLGDDFPAVFRFTSAGVHCMWMVAPWISEEDE